MRTEVVIAMMVASLTIPGLTVRLDAATLKPIPRFNNPREITNLYFPLAALKQDILEGKKGSKKIRVERSTKADIQKTFQVGDQKVKVLAVEDREFENDTLVEVTLDYFAQADDGTVYYLGEDVNEYKKGAIVGHSGAWLYGVDTEVPGVMMPAMLKVGDKFQSENVPKITREDDEVVSISERLTVPAGTYQNCLRIKEVLSDGKVEYKYYAKGVGCVKEVSEEGELLLKSHSAHGPVEKAGGQTAGGAQQVPSSANQSPRQSKPPLQDSLAREALSFVGYDPEAEGYWVMAINNPSLPAPERQDLIEDLNEDGFPEPDNPTLNDLPLILSRIAIIEQLAPWAMDRVNADAFQEAHKDLVNMATSVMSGN